MGFEMPKPDEVNEPTESVDAAEEGEGTETTREQIEILTRVRENLLQAFSRVPRFQKPSRFGEVTKDELLENIMNCDIRDGAIWSSNFEGALGGHRNFPDLRKALEVTINNQGLWDAKKEILAALDANKADIEKVLALRAVR